MPGQSSSAKENSTLSRQAWVDGALHRLAQDGIDRVRVAPLAREFGVTKGSFYWHFEDRQDLLDAMLERWERVGTQQIIEQVEGGGGTAAERLRQVVALSIEHIGGRLEPALRDWARRDERVRRAIRRIDERRMDYLRQQFGALYPDPAEAEARSWLFYSLLSGVHLIAARPAVIEREALLSRCLAVLAPGGL